MAKSENRKIWEASYYERNKELIAQRRRDRLAARTPEQVERDKAAQQVRNIKNYTENRDRILEIKRLSREKHREKYNENARIRRANAKEKPFDHLKKYGITKHDYMRMLSEQNGVCAICSQSDSIRLAVDHCHNTGAVRGLLCSRCNTSIGKFNDDVDLLRKAIDYLEKNNGKDVANAA